MSLNTMNLVLLGVTFSAAYGLPLLQPTCPGILNYSPMPQITALNSESVNQVLSKMRLLGQAMEVLTTVIMCDAQGSSKPITCLPTPQHPCYSGVESSLSDNLNATERLANGYTLLKNLTTLLNDSVKYDIAYNNGVFAPCLEQVLLQLADITEGLSSMLNESELQDVESDGTSQPVDTDDAKQCIQQQLHYGDQLKSALKSCRCLGIVTSPQDEYQNVFEVKLGLNVALQDVQSLLSQQNN